MGLIIKILKWFGVALGTMLGITIGELSKKYVFRAAAVAAMAYAYYLAFNVTYTTVKGMITSAVGHAQGGSGVVANGIEIAMCLLPSTLPEAITVLLGIGVQALAIKWTRMVLFAKLA